jgi:hypothetical protein
MNELKAEVKKVLTVQYRDLEEFVAASWDVAWSFVAAEEAGNDTEHLFTIDGHVDDYDQKILNGFFHNPSDRSYPGARIVLNELAAHGLIERGDYIVKVCW